MLINRANGDTLTLVAQAHNAGKSLACELRNVRNEWCTIFPSHSRLGEFYVEESTTSGIEWKSTKFREREAQLASPRN
jgi:hypothetical protein